MQSMKSFLTKGENLQKFFSFLPKLFKNSFLYSYKTNTIKLARLVDDAPMNSVDKAVWHLESVIRNKGASHLKYPQKEIPFYQYHFYDILLSGTAFVVLILLLVYGFVKSLRKCSRKVISVFKKKTD